MKGYMIRNWTTESLLSNKGVFLSYANAETACVEIAEIFAQRWMKKHGVDGITEYVQRDGGFLDVIIDGSRKQTYRVVEIQINEES